MIRCPRIWCVLYLLVSLVPWTFAYGQMPATGTRCELKVDAHLYMARDGDQVGAKVSAGDVVTFKAAQSETRRMVQSAAGVIGFLEAQNLAEICNYLAGIDNTRTKVEHQAPDLDAADITQTAAALEATRAAAEGILQDQDIIQEQRAQIEKATDARTRARGTNVLSPQSHMIRIAVYDLELSNVPESLGSSTTESLLQEVRKLKNVSAIGMDEIREMLDFEAQRQSMGCDADDQCLAEIAGALGVDELLTGKLFEGADGRSMTIKRIDQRRAEIVQTFSKRLEMSNGEEFLLAVGEAVETLFPQRPLKEGMTRGVDEKAVLRLSPPPIPTWATYTTFAAGLLAASVASYAYLQGQSLDDEVLSLADGQNPIPAERWSDALTDYQNYQQLNQVSLYTSGGLLLTGAMMSFFTDWLGYGEDE